VTYGGTVPSAAQTAFNNLVNTYQNLFNNNVAVNITVNFGATGLGESTTQAVFVSYSTWRAALVSNANANLGNTSLQAAVASLPASDPLGRGTVLLSTANARAIGLPGSTSVDSTLTFSNSVTFEYNGVPSSGAFDFMDVAAHELNEALGIGSALTGLANNASIPSNDYEAEDYFRYSAAGTRDITTNKSAVVYFSQDGGTTNVSQFNQDNGFGDRNDWIYGNFGCPAATLHIQNATGCPNQAVVVGSGPEVIVLNALGYNPPSGASTTKATFAFRDSMNAIRMGTFPATNLMSAGGTFAADPAAAQDASGNTFVVGRDNFGGLWLNVFNAGSQSWTGWNQAGGVFQGAPSITVSGETACFAGRGNANEYWTNCYSAGTGFSGWINLGGVFSTDPVVASVSDGSFYIVGKDNSNAIWTGRYILGTGFQGWFQAGGVVKGKPSVTGGNDGAAYIAVRDTSDGIWMARVFHNTLTGWFQGGGVISADPQVASLGNGVNCTVVLDVSGGTWYRPFQEGVGYQPWVAAGGKLQSVSPAGVNGELFFVGRTPSLDIWWWRQSGAQWTSIGNTGVSTGQLATSPR
jgi:hypothetical protein